MLPKNDAELSQFLGNFITVANANLATLGLSDAQMDALTSLKETLDARITAETTAREAALAATAGKQTAVKDALANATPFAKMIVANPAVSVALKEELGLKVPKPPTVTPPIVPIAVAVFALPNGTNTVTWKANGNIKNTQYFVQQKVSQRGEWRIVGGGTAQKFLHTGQTPGRHVLYRVFAQRGGDASAPSVEAVAYGNAAFPLED